LALSTLEESLFLLYEEWWGKREILSFYCLERPLCIYCTVVYCGASSDVFSAHARTCTVYTEYMSTLRILWSLWLGSLKLWTPIWKCLTCYCPFKNLITYLGQVGLLCTMWRQVRYIIRFCVYRTIAFTYQIAELLGFKKRNFTCVSPPYAICIFKIILRIIYPCWLKKLIW
jgi:hypothetical protein